MIRNNERFKDKLPVIVSRTINLSAKQYHAQAVREITKIYNFPRKRLKLKTGKGSKRKKVAMLWSTPSNLKAILSTMSRPQNLIEFSKATGIPRANWAKALAQNTVGVKVKVMKRGGLTRIKHAFIAPGKYSKKPLVYWRVAGSNSGTKAHTSSKKSKTRLVGRYPIKALYGVSITQMFGHPIVEANSEAYYQKQFDKNITNKTKAYM